MVTDGLMDWYQRAQRDLPWRENREPYRVWVSEVMLQQTRVETVIPYYKRFLEALPTVADLAAAKEERLLKLWEGLGYYSRVRNMQKAAECVAKMGEFPRNAKQLMQLPGFGPYTAGAVASIAFGERVAAVDGNVLRVYARMERVGQSIKMPSVRRECTQWVLQAMPPDQDAGLYNQALMELGAMVCMPQNPRCAMCPVAMGCGAFEHDEVEQYPAIDPKPAKAVEAFDVYLVVHQGRALVRKRPPKGLLAGLWEFPHGVSGVLAGQEICNVKHVFTHKIWLMRGVQGTVQQQPDGCVWVDAAQLQALPMASAMEAFRRVLLEGGKIEWKS